MNFFFTSDTHFGHKNIINYCNRPFDTVEKMNETLIEKWNKKVGKKDIVYHLGDFCMGDPKQYIDHLNGKIYSILGNHDKQIEKIWKQLGWIKMIKTVKIGGVFITLCHYPFEVWNKSHFNQWHLHGHCHGTLQVNHGKRYDVGVDSNGYEPVEFEELRQIMENKPNNKDFIG